MHKNDDINFYAKQSRTSLVNCGKIDPEDIEDCLAHKGYEALLNILENFTPEQVCQEMIDSGLRGRGGGGFPTGRKWNFVRIAQGYDPANIKKYIICNGDKGDPGAFMDRSIMEGDPHKVLEGMAIAAYAVGADEGYIYVRAEYPLAVHRLRVAIKQAEDHGLLGKNIFGKDFSFTFILKEGAGALYAVKKQHLLLLLKAKEVCQDQNLHFLQIKDYLENRPY